jgi:hypothetical protein
MTTVGYHASHTGASSGSGRAAAGGWILRRADPTRARFGRRPDHPLPIRP